MTLRLTQLRFAAAAFFAVTSAIAVVSLTGASARAFTMETLSTGGNSTRFADPDERVKNFGQGSQPFGQNGPSVQFGGGQSSPYRSFGPRGGYAPPPPLVGGN
jgi:hypothetical protein